MAFPWGSAIAAGGQLLGGVIDMFGKKKKGPGFETLRNQNYLNYMKQIQGVTDAAKKFGFHPLALLGSSGGGGGFATPVPYDAGGRQFGIGDAVGAGLSAFGELYQSDQDRLEEEGRFREEMGERRRERALEILRSKEITPEVRMQRENMALQNDLLRLDIAQSRSKLANLRAASIGGAPRTLTDAIGIGLTPKPGRASAQDMQDEYGDIVENVYGVTNWLQDMWTAKNPKWWDDFFNYSVPSLGAKLPRRNPYMR